MTKSISMAITDEAYELWDQYKKDTNLTQNDAMTKLIVDTLKPKEHCAADIAREARDRK